MKFKHGASGARATPCNVHFRLRAPRIWMACRRPRHDNESVIMRALFTDDRYRMRDRTRLARRIRLESGNSLRKCPLRDRRKATSLDSSSSSASRKWRETGIRHATARGRIASRTCDFRKVPASIIASNPSPSRFQSTLERLQLGLARFLQGSLLGNELMPEGWPRDGSIARISLCETRLAKSIPLALRLRGLKKEKGRGKEKENDEIDAISSGSPNQTSSRSSCTGFNSCSLM